MLLLLTLLVTGSFSILKKFRFSGHSKVFKKGPLSFFRIFYISGDTGKKPNSSPAPLLLQNRATPILRSTLLSRLAKVLLTCSSSVLFGLTAAMTLRPDNNLRAASNPFRAIALAKPKKNKP